MINTQKEREDQLVNACILGDNTACLALAHTDINDAIPLYRLHFWRFFSFLFLINALPIIIGFYLLYFLGLFTIGFFAIGIGIVFLIITFTIRNWFIQLSLLRAILVTVLLTGLWITLVLIFDIFL